MVIPCSGPLGAIEAAAGDPGRCRRDRRSSSSGSDGAARVDRVKDRLVAPRDGRRAPMAGAADVDELASSVNTSAKAEPSARFHTYSGPRAGGGDAAASVSWVSVVVDMVMLLSGIGLSVFK